MRGQYQSQHASSTLRHDHTRRRGARRFCRRTCADRTDRQGGRTRGPRRGARAHGEAVDGGEAGARCGRARASGRRCRKRSDDGRRRSRGKGPAADAAGLDRAECGSRHDVLFHRLCEGRRALDHDAGRRDPGQCLGPRLLRSVADAHRRRRRGDRFRLPRQADAADRRHGDAAAERRQAQDACRGGLLRLYARTRRT